MTTASCRTIGKGREARIEVLFVTLFPTTKDFGSFFGFVRGRPLAATLTVEDLKKALRSAPTPA